MQPSPPAPGTPSADVSKRRSQLLPKLAPTPRTGKEAAREAVVDTVLNARALAGEALRDFRASDRFFKQKAAIVALWLVLSAASLVIACPSAVPGTSNSLKARVRLEKVAAGMDRHITALFIENRSKDDWVDVRLSLNSTYSAAVPLIAAGRSAVVQLDKFSDAQGRTPPPQMEAQRLKLNCSEGSTTFDDLRSADATP